MTTIEAIETSYAGYRFRSRTEARWAVFLKHVGIDFKYEPQGYVLDGEPYLPDFLIHPGTPLETWLEIKGTYPSRGEIAKAVKLAEGTGIRTYLYFGDVVLPGAGLSERITTWDAFFAEWGFAPQWHNEHGWILNGTEAFRWEADLRPTAFRFDPDDSPGAVKSRREPKSGFWWWTDCPVCGRVVLKHHGMVGWCPTIPDWDGHDLPAGVSPVPQMAHETDSLLAAYTAARSARFEHGETPAEPRASRDPKPIAADLKGHAARRRSGGKRT
jgi:hypothetical protein